MPQSIRRAGIRKNTIVVNIAATPLAAKRKKMTIEAPRPQFLTRKPVLGSPQSPAEKIVRSVPMSSAGKLAQQKPSGPLKAPPEAVGDDAKHQQDGN